MNKKDKIIKYLITTMFILLPIIDMIRTTSIKDVEVFNIAIIELVNLLLIGISFLLTIPKIKKKHLKYLSVYFIAIMIYTILHIINTYHFDISLFPGAIHNYIVEFYYIIRVYVLPLLLMIVLFENKKIFNRKYYLNIVKYLVLFISGQIVLLNLCRFSYSTYTGAINQYAINHTSFYDVFKMETGYKGLLTVGLFSSANQISLILFMLLPLNIYNLYLKANYKNTILIVLQVISMIIIGTKVAAVGSIAVLVAALIIYYFFIILKKEKHKKLYVMHHLVALAIGVIVLVISPFTKLYFSGSMSQDFKGTMTEEEMEEVREKINYDMDTEELVEILNEYPSVFKISPMFYEIYPIENDKEFWIKMALRDRELNNNYRILKNDIIKRVVERNDNKYDKYLGIGYTIGSIDMEKDYVYQKYLFGIIGLFLLIGVYILYYMYNVLKIFNKKYFNYNFCICLLPPFLVLVACYFSGHLFGWVSPMIILASTLSIGRVNN